MKKSLSAMMLLTVLLCACNGLESDSQPAVDPVSAWPLQDIYPTPTPASSFGSSSSGLWASDPDLSAPTGIGAISTDNAIIVSWRDDLNTTQTGYIICFNNCSETSALRVNDKNARTAWFIGVPYYNGEWRMALLVPNNNYSFQVVATGGRGISSGTQITKRLTQPTILIGYPSGNVSRPTADQAFAIWDWNNNGIVDGAPGSGGAFPFFPTNQGAQPVVNPGNQFDRTANVRANMVVGYFFNESGSRRFVAFHMFVDPATNQHTPISVLYGDTEVGVSGRLVWVGGIQQSSYQTVIEGDPNIIQGTVTAPTLAFDGSTRIIEFTFLLAPLVER